MHKEFNPPSRHASQCPSHLHAHDLAQLHRGALREEGGENTNHLLIIGAQHLPRREIKLALVLHNVTFRNDINRLICEVTIRV